jgi:streptogramin lyase
VLRFIPLAVALGAAALGCGGDPDVCVDGDADGYGEGCERGPDCDDENAARNVDCERVPPPDCSADPFATGCPCLTNARAVCFDGPPESIDVGLCLGGRTLCVNGHWGICEGAVAPRGEVCDTRDQDCDGLVDEGVQSPCGGCEPGCNGGVWGEADAPFEDGDDLFVGPEGDLTLAFAERLVANTVWVANSGEGTISKIDATSATEVARYRTGGSEPSRVAVDYRGDAWVANREFEGVPTLTKIAGDPSRCVDAAGDGLTTSTGPSDVLPFGEDECVLFRTDVGTMGEVARALAIDGDLGLDESSGGNAWVGLHEGHAVVVVDGITGAVLDRIETPDFSPYAAAFDAWGTLWLSSRDGYLARIHRGAMPREATIFEVPLGCYLLYSLTVDVAGRVVATGFSCDDVVAYDPRRDIFRRLATPPSPRGIAIADGDFFIAHTGGYVSRLDPDATSVLDTTSLTSSSAEPLESIGVGVDGAGDVWIANGQGGAGGVGVATRVNAADGTVTAQVPVGLAPHTQGDLTGAELRGGFVPEGETSHVFDGCRDGETEWARVHVDAFIGPSGSVEVAARHAATPESLPSASWVVLGTMPTDAEPFPLDFPLDGVVEVRLVLTTDDLDGAPRIFRVGLEWVCPGPD